MLVAVQLPVVDLRAFVPPMGTLPVPGWPAPEADREFLRAFGGIRHRPSGGLSGWLGEATVCDVSGGVRFAEPLPGLLGSGLDVWSFKCAYRRFFFDGLATGKFEFGFRVTPAMSRHVRPSTADLVSNLLKLPLADQGKSARALAVAGTDLARRYARATTAHSGRPNEAQRFVIAGRPCIVIDHGRQRWRNPTTSKLLRSGHEITGVFWHQREYGQDIPVWVLYRNIRRERGVRRHLRLYLFRLHAEIEAIAKILKAISTGAISPRPRSRESDNLQLCLLTALRHQRRTREKISERLESSFFHEALWHRDYSLPGYYEGLSERLIQLGPRKAVLRKIIQYIQDREDQDRATPLQIMGDYVMTKITNSGNAGIVAQSVDAKAATVTGNQTTLGTTGRATLEELNRLAQELRNQAKAPDDEVAAEAVEKAAKKLNAGDEPAALAWLKRSGTWALKVAEDIGTKLAAEAIIRASTT